MTKKEQDVLRAEQFVRRVITETFKQKVDKEVVKAIAEKVSKAVPTNSSKKAA